MRKMRESGSTWIGQSPNNWPVTPIKYCIDTRQAGSWGEKETSEESICRKNCICIRVADFDFRSFSIQDKQPYTIRSYEKQTISKLKLQRGDILIEKSGGGEKTPVGRAVIFDNDFDALYSNFLERLHLKPEINPKYFLYSWNSFYKLGHTRLYIKQTTGIQNLNFSKILTNESILVPSIDEQNAIANFLDNKCAEIDALTSDIEKQIETLQEYKKSVITEAVTKGLDPNVKMKDSSVEWIGSVPKNWKVIAAKHCVNIENGSDPVTDGDTPVYGSGAESFRRCGEFKLGPSVLIGRKGTINIPRYITGKFWNVDTAFNVYSKNETVIKLKYYYYLSTSFDYKRYINQTTLPGMTRTAYENMRIPLPSVIEQQQIIEFLDNRCSEIDTLISDKHTMLSSLAQFKQSLIYEYVTGKKTVPNA